MVSSYKDRLDYIRHCGRTTNRLSTPNGHHRLVPEETSTQYLAPLLTRLVAVPGARGHFMLRSRRPVAYGVLCHEMCRGPDAVLPGPPTMAWRPRTCGQLIGKPRVETLL